MTTSTVQTTNQLIALGNRNDNPPGWTPFEWEDPVHGSQAKGEVTVIREAGTTGSLMAGLWRTGHEIAGCETDGSCWVKYSAPLGDETMLLLEGTAVITETATGRKHQVGAGTIISNPKNVDLYWEISAPFLKKFWVMWDSPEPATPLDHLIVANISDVSATWAPHEWVEPENGRQSYGEEHIIRSTGSTGSYLVGLWRSGVGIPGAQEDGSTTFRTTSPDADETILILEGNAHLLDEQSGQAHELKAGDAIGLPQGLPVTWTSRSPFVKTFFVRTNATTSTF